MRKQNTFSKRALWSVGYMLFFALGASACAKHSMGAQAALFHSDRALRTARATGPAQTDRVARHLAAATSQLEQAHALAQEGDTQGAICAADKSQLDSHLATALNVLAADESSAP